MWEGGTKGSLLRGDRTQRISSCKWTQGQHRNKRQQECIRKTSSNKTHREVVWYYSLLIQSWRNLQLLPGQAGERRGPHQLITYGEADEIMNSKSEYHQPGVTSRVVGRWTERSSTLFSRPSRQSVAKTKSILFRLINQSLRMNYQIVYPPLTLE